MVEACTDCPVARIHRDRIAALEDRLERAEALLDPAHPSIAKPKTPEVLT